MATAGDRFELDRVLVVGDTIERVLTNERLMALVETPGFGLARLTVALSCADSDIESARNSLGRFLERLESGEGIQFEVCLPEHGLPSDDLLRMHDVLVPGEETDDHALIIRAWQLGLCVVNSVEQARAVAAFDGVYIHEGAWGWGANTRWYSILEGKPVYISNPQNIVLGYGARINPRAVIINEGLVQIGRASLIGADAELNLFTAKFSLGQFCHISSNFTAVGYRHTMHSPTTFNVTRGPYAFIGEVADKVGDIVIGNDVWIGTRVVVLQGVHIADGCIVGAGSVVTKSLTEPYGIYAGNPAKLIRHRFPPHIVKWLCAIQWWNWPTKRLWEERSFFQTDITAKTEEELWGLVEHGADAGNGQASGI